MPIKVLHVGLGPIGAGVVRQVAGRKGLTIVGAVDIDPAKVGRDLGEVCDVGRKLRVKVGNDIAAAIKASRPDVAILCTSSSLKKVVPEFEAVLKHKVPIVSTTEELAYPVKSNGAVAKKLDALAKRSFRNVSPALRQNILTFYGSNPAPSSAGKRDRKSWPRVQRSLVVLSSEPAGRPADSQR